MSETQQGEGVSRERRAQPRHVANLPVTVQVLVEEQTFSPFVFDGVCDNISRSGALVAVRDLSKNTYTTLIQRRRFIRVSGHLPGRETPITLFGKLIWFDFQDVPGSSMCKLAMSFEPMKDDVAEALDEYLQSIPRISSVLPATSEDSPD
jgi:hypothetical protein